MLLRQEYHVNGKKEEVHPTTDSGKAKANAVVQIDDIMVAVNDMGKRPMVFGKSVNSPIQRPIMANDHEQSGSSSTTNNYH